MICLPQKGPGKYMDGESNSPIMHEVIRSELDKRALNSLASMPILEALSSSFVGLGAEQ